MTSVAIAFGIASIIVLVLGAAGHLANGRRFAAEVRRRGIKPEAIQSYDADQGFLLFDCVYGGSIGIGRPVVWWCVAEDDDYINVQSIQLIDIPKADRTLLALKAIFPDKRIVESNSLPFPLPTEELY